MELPRPEREVGVTTGGSHDRTAGCLSVAILGLAVAWLFALDATPASANHVSCGDEITTDTTLDSDLLDCPDHGLVIGADDVTLDLNGHLIDGDGICATGEFCSGVHNDDHDGVTVRDGSVRQFIYAGVVVRASENRVVDISASENLMYGISVEGDIGRLAHILVRDSFATDNGLSGINVQDSHDGQIVDNSVLRNKWGLEVTGGTDNLVKFNEVSHNSEYGIWLGDSHTQLRRNRFVRNRTGIYVFGDRDSAIARNRISGGRRGINIAEGHGTRVAGNVINRPHVYGLRARNGENIVRRNLVRKSGGDGFAVKPNNHAVRLSDNIARRARDDGFDIRRPSTKLTGNRAVRNGDLGIDAVAGVTDGGGNRAHGNGDPRQCRNVACR